MDAVVDVISEVPPHRFGPECGHIDGVDLPLVVVEHGELGPDAGATKRSAHLRRVGRRPEVVERSERDPTSGRPQ